MYCIYKKSRGLVLPAFDYTFNKFEEFYPIANVLTVSILGEYNICVKSDVYKDITEFIGSAKTYDNLKTYIEVSESVYNYIVLYNPSVSVLGMESTYDLFKKLVKKYGILFDSDSMKLLYYNIPHTYEDFDESLQLIKQTYPNVGTITSEHIKRLFVIEDIVYPYNVLNMFLLMKRWRWSRFQKCYDRFGNDLMYYAIRKQLRRILKDKISYLKSGNARDYIKRIPVYNILRLEQIFDYSKNKFNDIRNVFYLYERGVNTDDYMDKRTVELYT